MSRPFQAPIPVEESFDEFVKGFGGEIVKDLISKNPAYLNADYFFENRSIVAELKCLEKDTFRDAEYRKKMGIIYHKWMRQGLVPWTTSAGGVVQSKDLPMKCQLDVANLLKPVVERPIKKANRQIKQTKGEFNLPKAKGLLLLVNDGNYSLESDAVMYLVSRSIKAQYTAIHTVVYFTVNMLADAPGVNRDVLVWLDAPRDPADPLPRSFLDGLQKGWGSFLGRKLGEEIPEIKAKDDVIDKIKFLQHRRPT